MAARLLVRDRVAQLPGAVRRFELGARFREDPAAVLREQVAQGAAQGRGRGVGAGLDQQRDVGALLDGGERGAGVVAGIEAAVE